MLCVLPLYGPERYVRRLESETRVSPSGGIRVPVLLSRTIFCATLQLIQSSGQILRSINLRVGFSV